MLKSFQPVNIAKILAACVFILAVLVATILGLREIVTYLSDVLWPVAVATILSGLLRPFVNFFCYQCKLGRTASIVLLYVLFSFILVALFAYIFPLLISQVSQLISYAPSLFEKARDFAIGHYKENIGLLNEYVDEETISSYSSTLMSTAQNGLKKSLSAFKFAGSGISTFFSFIAGLSLIPIYLWYLLETKRDIIKDAGEEMVFLSDNLKHDILYLFNQFNSILISFFRGQFTIGLMMGILFAIGFTISGLKAGILLGLSVGLLNIVPYLGTIIGLSTVIPISLFQPDGGSSVLIGVAITFVVVQLAESFILTPTVMKKGTGLHPMAIMLSLFFWGKILGGLLGMILAIPLTAFIVIFWRLLKHKLTLRKQLKIAG